MSEKSSSPGWSPAAVAAIVAALLGGAVAVGPRVKDTAPAPSPPAAPADKPVTAAPPTPDPLVVLQEYFDYVRRDEPMPEPPAGGFELKQSPGGMNWTVNPTRKKPDVPPLAVPPYRPITYEFLICTLPDPADSKFAFAFDAAVDAIARAFQARNFVLQSSWLPWKRDSAVKPNDDPLHRRLPGTLLFRKIVKDRGDAPRVAVVCLVGENPISGVHGKALTEAVRCYDRLRLAVAEAAEKGRAIDPALALPVVVPGPSDRVRIVGPYYSGSQGGIKDALRAWQGVDGTAGACPRFRLISGTATAVVPDLYFPSRYRVVPVEQAAVAGCAAAAVHPAHVHPDFMAHYDADKPRLLLAAPTPGEGFGGEAYTPPAFTFESTAVRSELLTNAVLHYLGGGPASAVVRPTNDDDPAWQAGLAAAVSRLGRVAVLRESNTGWGVRQALDDTAAKPLPFIDLPFPSSISQIQFELEKLTDTAPAIGLSLPADFATPRLPVRDGTQRDGLTLYDRETTVALAAEMLRNTLATLHRERVRYVGIAATDARDVVFLNRLLHKHCPNVRTFTTEPSLILSQPAESYHLRGMVVGSPYPLFTPAKSWTGSARVPFSSASAQGIYNAVLAHYSADLPPLPSNSLQEYQSPIFVQKNDQQLARPPIWVSVVGSNGEAVPVRLYRQYSDPVTTAIGPDGSRVEYPDVPNKYTWTGPATISPDGDRLARLPAPPLALVLLVAAVCSVSVVVAGACLTDWWRHTILYDPADRFTDDVNRGRVLCWVSGLLFVVPLVPLLAAARPDYALDPNIQIRLMPGFSSWWVVVGLVVATLFAVLCTTLTLAFPTTVRGILKLGPLAWLVRDEVLGKQSEFRQHQGWPTPSLVASVTLSLILLAIPFWWVICPNDPGEQFLWLVRAADLASGLSPLLPTTLLAVAFGTAGLIRVQQARLRRVFEVPLPFPRCAKPGLPACFDARLAAVQEAHLWLSAVCKGMGVRSALFADLLTPTLCGGVLVFMWWFLLAAHRNLEGPVWDWAVFGSMATLSAVLAVFLIRFLTIWRRLKALMEAICELPMADAFEQLPDPVVRAFRRCQFTDRQRLVHLLLASHEWRQRFGSPLRSEPQANPHADPKFWQLADPLARAAGEKIAEMPAHWPKRSVIEAFGSSEPPKSGEASGGIGVGNDAIPAAGPPESIASGENFAAMVVVVYLSQFFAQLRLAAWVLTVCAPLSLMAAASYPFEPERPLLVGISALIGLIVAAVMHVLYQVNRNELVSRICKTAPGRFTPDRGFLESAAKFAGPLLLVVGLQGSGLLRVIFEPILGAAR